MRLGKGAQGNSRLLIVPLVAFFYFVAGCTVPARGTPPSKVTEGYPTSSSFLNPTPDKLEALNCSHLEFKVGDATYVRGTKIGKGVDGSVYSLVNLETKQAYTKEIVKIVRSNNYHRVLGITYGENKLAEILPDLVTPMKVQGIYKRENGEFVSIMRKKRVNGPMLHDLATTQIRQYPAQEIFQGLVTFRTELIDKLRNIALTKGEYVIDFHADNIMYDRLEKKFYLVDANWHRSWSDFFETVNRHNLPHNQHTAIPAIWDLIRQHKEGLPNDFDAQTKFFQAYVDIYLGKYVQALRKNLKPTASTIHPAQLPSTQEKAAMPFIVGHKKAA